MAGWYRSGPGAARDFSDRAVRPIKAIATWSPQARHLTQSSRLNMVIVPIFNLAKPRADL